MRDDVDLSIGQFRDAWRLFCAGSPNQSLATEEGTEYIFSGVPIGFFNVALLTGRRVAGDELQARGRRACEWAADKNVPWLFVMTHEALEPGVDPGSVLDGCDLAPMMALTGMLAPQILPGAPVPDGLQLTEAREDRECSSVLDVNSLAYGMDLEAGKALIGTGSFWRDQVLVLGLVNGKTVCSAAVLMVDGYRYVALVATDPSHQRRGYADAAMRRALEVASQRHGERPTVLHATDAGRPIYERMGYAPIATHTIFMEKRFLDSH
jgi:GNAT superfamily N-acetyltransferase